ncbi:MAG: Rrf2 family transcriptional regulator [Candidatus Omnitrophica bacterium]|nr:Rrf2 family transcriptional regulator [Candidatus Omnitrophota bacterium]
MKLSTKGRYGVRLMLDLAEHSNQSPIFLKDIAERQGISEKYLWQLISVLKNAGLVNSLRGAHGGYMLAKPSSEITLKDIILVLEGHICLVDCIDVPSQCRRAESCVTRDIWKEINDTISHTLEGLTLEKLVEKQKYKTETASYSI